MTEQTVMPPPIPAADVRPKRKWRWLKISGIVVALLFAIRILGSVNSPNLQLTRKDMWPGDGGKAVEMVNVGSKPINITKVMINDRADCSATLFTINDNLPNDNQAKSTGPFGIGDKITYASSCRIIRATVETNQGTETYSFAGN